MYVWVCVCVCAVIPFVLDVRLVGAPAGVTHNCPIFLLRCLPYFLSREGVSRLFPSSTVKSNFVYPRTNLLHELISSATPIAAYAKRTPPAAAELPLEERDAPIISPFTREEQPRRNRYRMLQHMLCLQFGLCPPLPPHPLCCRGSQCSPRAQAGFKFHHL